MIGWFDASLWALALALVVSGRIQSLRPFRSLLWASAAMILITSIYPRSGNPLGQYLFAGTASVSRLPREVFGIAWWLIGAWLMNAILDVVLRRTLFPRDDQPHARRLFADLAAVLFYVVAFVGIMETVMKQPISAVLATSGVLAIVLGLALQSTLSDVFSGLAINIDRPFGAGDWITVNPGVEGQVLEINWRSTRLCTWLNDVIIIPNSVVAKSVVTNHSGKRREHRSSFTFDVDSAFDSIEILDLLHHALNGAARGYTIEGATAFASDFGDSVVTYQVVYPLNEFGERARIQSELMIRIEGAFRDRAISVGAPATRVQILRSDKRSDKRSDGQPDNRSDERSTGALRST